MKTSIKDNDFKPIKIEIILDTKEEAERFYALFNNKIISNAFGHRDSIVMKHRLGEFFNADTRALIENRLVYSLLTRYSDYELEMYREALTVFPEIPTKENK